MLSHVVGLYRLIGGQSATTNEPRQLRRRRVQPHDHVDGRRAAHGAASPPTITRRRRRGGAFDLADVAADSTRYWRDSHDAGGPHAPFDLSDETQDGAPRGQVQYFRDPSSAAANAPLGRMDLTTLVDPSALEMDQDYDCVHNSNPSCSYVTYGPLCAPEAAKVGVDLYRRPTARSCRRGARRLLAPLAGPARAVVS